MQIYNKKNKHITTWLCICTIFLLLGTFLFHVKSYASQGFTFRFCTAGLLTYLWRKNAFPNVRFSGGGYLLISIFCENYSSGTVQDFHLIPFSSHFLKKDLWTVSAKVWKNIIYKMVFLFVLWYKICNEYMVE